MQQLNNTRRFFAAGLALVYPLAVYTLQGYDEYMKKRSTKHAGTHGLAVSPETKSKVLVQLRRIEGQVRGIHGMVELERYCPEVMVQISAVHESLRTVGKLLLKNHLEHCATDAIRSGDSARARKTYDELTALFYKHAR
jgi:DNA-binding FrmR family transcriptional regulator